jgi:hypothetical protein
LAAQLRRKYLGTRQFSSRDLTVQRDEHHPCWKSAHFLPCTRPPDVMCMHRPQRRATFGLSECRAFVATRSGLQTMPSGGLGYDADTVADDSCGNVRQPATLVKSADLQTALAPPDDRDFGTKIYENIGLSYFTPAPVTRACELLGLRSYFMSQLGPRYLWIIKLSMIEWPTLSAQEKKLHAVMRKSFVTSYAFGAEAILQHWLWKTLKNATQSFGPLQRFNYCTCR